MPTVISWTDLLRAVILILISGLGVGMLPNMTKLALLAGGDPASVLVARTFFALCALGAYIKLTGGSLGIPKEAIPIALVAGSAMAIQTYTAVLAINHIDISLMMLILFVHPFLVAIYYHVEGTTRLTLLRLLWSGLAFAGVGLALSVDFSRLSTIGLLSSAGSALACGVLVVAMVGLGKHANTLTATFQLSIYPLILGGISMGLAGKVELPTTMLGWIGIAGAGAAIVIAFVAFLGAARIIGGSRASVMSFIEPIFAIVIASIMFGEHLSGLQWTGALLVAFGLFMLEAPAAFATHVERPTPSSGVV
jgi:drug/metabolite transporter (DMT)-like permease